MEGQVSIRQKKTRIEYRMLAGWSVAVFFPCPVSESVVSWCRCFCVFAGKCFSIAQPLFDFVVDAHSKPIDSTLPPPTAQLHHHQSTSSSSSSYIRSRVRFYFLHLLLTLLIFYFFLLFCLSSRLILSCIVLIPSHPRILALQCPLYHYYLSPPLPNSSKHPHRPFQSCYYWSPFSISLAHR